MNINEGIFFRFPSSDELINWYRTLPDKKIPDINGHIHTPHSFSAFPDIEKAFQMAESEGIGVLGINDFYTTGGYEEFAALSVKYRVFPLFNIEFMSLQDHQQKDGVLVNDPNNPGRTYFSGKGLKHPVRMSETSFAKIKILQEESNRQTYLMVDRLNDYFAGERIGIRFNADELKERLAKNIFRERHIAQAIRIAVFDKESTTDSRLSLLKRVFAGKSLNSDISDIAGVENEIRSNLLKAGGPAFVPEDPRAFLSLSEVVDLIIDAGGIPCYPVLLDDPAGNITEYEKDKEKLLNQLLSNDVYSVEFITGRNDFKMLKEYVNFFRENGFLITFGTEHNTPRLDPLKLTCRGGVPLDEELKRVNFEGAAVIAAHQYLNAKGMEGYLKGKRAKTDEKDNFVELGESVINWFLKSM
jgi:hypothetical protein